MDTEEYDARYELTIPITRSEIYFLILIAAQKD